MTSARERQEQRLKKTEEEAAAAEEEAEAEEEEQEQEESDSSIILRRAQSRYPLYGQTCWATHLIVAVLSLPLPQIYKTISNSQPCSLPL